MDDLVAGVGVLQLGDVDIFGSDAGGLISGLGGVDGGRDVLVQRGEGGMHFVGTVGTGADLGCAHVDRFVGVLVRDVGPAHDHGRGTLVGRAEHVLRQRVVQDGRVEDLIFGNRLAAKGIRVQRTVAEVLGGDLGQRGLGDVVVVEVL